MNWGQEMFLSFRKHCKCDEAGGGITNVSVPLIIGHAFETEEFRLEVKISLQLV
jgi:hypothetical protein